MQNLPSFFILTALFIVSATAKASQTIEFWNGNKTETRQQYELDVLNAALAATTAQYGAYQIDNDTRQLTNSEESAVFRDKNADVFVTVAGNPKLRDESKIIVTHPLMKGLLGYRLLIVKEQALDKFAAIDSAEEFKQLRAGIPDGWADADLFRHNGYNVVEEGTFDDLFERFAAGQFDYVAFGANEIEKVFDNRAAAYKQFHIEPTKLVYYPFALVFYVSPDKPELAERLRKGLKAIEHSGEAERLFEQATQNLVDRLNLHQRTRFELTNPQLPAEMKNYRSDLLSQ